MTNARTRSRSARPVALVAAVLATPALAQPNQWIGAGPGLWSDATMWSDGVSPTLYDQVHITDGSTVTLDIVSPNISSLYFGYGPGEYGGLLSAGATSFVQGTLCYLGFQGGGDIQIDTDGYVRFTSTTLGGYNAASVGMITVNGGEFRSTSLYGGNAGTGEVVINDGEFRVTSFTLAYQPGSVGSITQYGGLFTSTTFYASYDGTGTLSLQGGTATFNSGNVGMTTVGPPGQMLIGGTADVQASSITVGANGNGEVNQTGGDLDVGYINLTSNGVATGDGTYNLGGGVLDATYIRPGIGVNQQFNMTGGTLLCYEFGQSGATPLTLAPTGGLIRPRGDFLSYMRVYGDFNLGAGAALEMEMNTEFSSDRLDVYGTVTLAGSLAPVLIAPPDPGDTFTVINNDALDPVVGTFAGLPEGASFILSDGPDDYEYFITYVGGDGNDVVLQIDCPTDFTGDGVLDSADIAAFITAFLAGDISADLSGDGFFDSADINIFTTAYLVGC